MIRAIDICAGAGGWACAADRLEGKPIKIVAAIDMAEDCLETYKYNHDRPGGVAEGCEFIQDDVRNVNFSRFKGVDLGLGGIPCETITKMRNQSMPGGDELFTWLAVLDACLKAVETIGPAQWCFEDVVQIINFLPPQTPFKKINSAQYGPQNRERAYVGNFPPPLPGDDSRVLRDCLTDGPHNFPLVIKNKKPNPRGSAWHDPGTYRQLSLDKKCPTVVHAMKNAPGFVIQVDNQKRRCLSLTEHARVQGFPSDYIFIGPQRRMAKMIAQAVQVDTGLAILDAIVAAHMELAA